MSPQKKRSDSKNVMRCARTSHRLPPDRAGAILRRRMIADPGRYADAIARFDAANAEDPNTESTGGGG